MPHTVTIEFSDLKTLDWLAARAKELDIENMGEYAPTYSLPQALAVVLNTGTGDLMEVQAKAGWWVVAIDGEPVDWKGPRYIEAEDSVTAYDDEYQSYIDAGYDPEIARWNVTLVTGTPDEIEACRHYTLESVFRRVMDDDPNYARAGYKP